MKLRDLTSEQIIRILVSGDDYVSVGVLVDALDRVKVYADKALNDMTDTREYEVQYLEALESIMDIEIDL